MFKSSIPLVFLMGHKCLLAHKHTYEVYVLVQIDLHIYAIHRFRYLYLALSFIEHWSRVNTHFTLLLSLSTSQYARIFQNIILIELSNAIQLYVRLSIARNI